VIIDRSFKNLDSVVYHKFYGQAGNALYKWATCCARSTSDLNFLKKKMIDSNKIEPPGIPCYKVLTCEVNDEIVSWQASLMVGVARKVCEQPGKPLRNIWSAADCNILTKAIQNLMLIDKCLFEYINPRIVDKFLNEKE